MSQDGKHLMTEGETEVWRQQLPESFLMCRDLGHQWRPATARWDAEERCYERSMRCGRCRTVREQTLSAYGEVLAGHYEYVDGYAAPPGVGRLSGMARAGLRLESVTRAIGRAERADEVAAKRDRKVG